MTNEQQAVCGFVAILGRPNVGKSTLLNQFMQKKVSSVSRKPQTTRQQIRGIKTTGYQQFIFVDTPGIHNRNKTMLDKAMNKAAWASLADVDVVLLMLEANQWQPMDEHILQKLNTLAIPVIVAINKVDRLIEKSQLLPQLKRVEAALPQAVDYIPISAEKAINTDELLFKLGQQLPIGPHCYENNQWTDRGLKFLCAEMVREKLMRFLGQELPYVTAVTIETIEDTKARLTVNALIWVERDSQKAIIIGKKGEKLKTIGTEARKELERLFNKKVVLKTWVKVKTGWTNDQKALDSLGFEDY